MPKFAFKRLIFGAVVKIFRGEAESGLKILMRFLVKISRFFQKIFRGRVGERSLADGGGKNFQKNVLNFVKDFWGPKLGFYIAKGAEILEAS